MGYIAKDSPKAAIEQGDRVLEQVNQLVREPTLSGCAGRKKCARELVISRTPFILVRVKPRAARIEILRVLHSSRRYP
ncbi:MAG: type II toxin-antitoxin system RelE/ParE family toxin [Sulfuritalea sp.]|nr:type II toxin-antitoxin system RelE/ParE family toxin [Sulfuritalea sp.]